MSNLQKEKLKQASALVKDSGLGAWITLVRETAGGSDPILPLILDGGLTWTSALIVTEDGESIAVVGNYDAEPLEKSGNWTQVIPYVQGIREPLLQVLEEKVAPGAKIGLNFSPSDQKSDGLSHGLWLVLQEVLQGTRFTDCIVSAERVTSKLRGQKTATELARIRHAIAETEKMFPSIQQLASTNVSERAIFDFVHDIVEEQNYGFSWDPTGDPIVNSGPHSMIGHGVPSDSIFISDGHIFHIDIGLKVNGYSSDLQRIWYVGSETIPEDVSRAFTAVRKAIQAGFETLKPGVLGWQIDQAARSSLISDGYPEYLHALGHQVGMEAHDGGTILGPRWERYGNTPMQAVCEHEVYTLELGVMVEGRGYLGLEEMVVVTSSGAEWLSTTQQSVWNLI